MQSHSFVQQMFCLGVSSQPGTVKMLGHEGASKHHLYLGGVNCSVEELGKKVKTIAFLKAYIIYVCAVYVVGY